MHLPAMWIWQSRKLSRQQAALNRMLSPEFSVSLLRDTTKLGDQVRSESQWKL